MSLHKPPSVEPDARDRYLPHPPDFELDTIITVSDADTGPTDFHSGTLFPGMFDLNWYGWPYSMTRVTPITITAHGAITAENGQNRSIGPVPVTLHGFANLVNTNYPQFRRSTLEVTRRQALGGTLHFDPRELVTPDYPIVTDLYLTVSATARYGVASARRTVTTTMYVQGIQIAIN